MKEYNCTCCLDTGWLEYYDRDQDAWYTYRMPCPECKANESNRDQLVDVLEIHPAWKEDQAYKRNSLEVI